MRNINIMFREVKDMVYEQGTMIDRIDYNIERADRNVKSANKELDEVGARSKQILEGYRGVGMCMQMCLLGAIYFLLLINLLRWI